MIITIITITILKANDTNRTTTTTTIIIITIIARLLLANSNTNGWSKNNK